MEAVSDDRLTPVLVYKDRNETVPYAKIVVPNTMRSPYWKFFGFPADGGNNILTRTKIICCICRSFIAYNKNTTNLITHLNAKHQDIVKQYYTTDKPQLEGTDHPTKRFKLNQPTKLKGSVFGSLKSTYLNYGEHPTGIKLKEAFVPATESKENIKYFDPIKDELNDENWLFDNGDEDSVNGEGVQKKHGTTESFRQLEPSTSITENIIVDQDQQGIEFLDEEYLSDLEDGTKCGTPPLEIITVFEKKTPILNPRDVKLKTKNDPKNSQPTELEHKVKEFLINDLIDPNIVEGNGFRGLLQSLTKSSDIPNRAEISQSITASYYSKKTDLDLFIKEIMRNQNFSLYFDKFPDEEDNCKSIINVSICYLDSTDHTLKHRLFYFTPCVSTMYLEELNISPDRCSAAVFNFSLEGSEFKLFFHQKGIPTIETFTSIVERIIEKCLKMEEIRESIASIEDILGHPITGRSFLQSNRSRLEDYNSLTYFLDNFIPEGSTEHFFSVIKTAVDALQPLKKYLEILSQENIRMASIMMPLAQKLITEDFSEDRMNRVKATGSESLLRQIAVVVRTDVTEKISNNWFLTMTSFLDPRFQNIMSTDDLNNVQRQLEEQLSDENTSQSKKFENQQIKKTESTRDKKSGLSLLFGDRAVLNKTTKPRNRFEIEFRSYIEDVDADINQCPLQWWAESENLYPNISKQIERYFCVPCFVAGVDNGFLKKIDTKLFMKDDVYRQLVWLHYDRFYFESL